jgi:flavin-binding protein dodecin
MDKAYKLIEVVGTSKESFARAADAAVRKAAETIHNLDWLEVVSMRGRIDAGRLAEYQVTVKIGFRLD